MSQQFSELFYWLAELTTDSFRIQLGQITTETVWKLPRFQFRPGCWLTSGVMIFYANVVGFIFTIIILSVLTNYVICFSLTLLQWMNKFVENFWFVLGQTTSCPSQIQSPLGSNWLSCKVFWCTRACPKALSARTVSLQTHGNVLSKIRYYSTCNDQYTDNVEERNHTN